jgi:hypothetical protein
MLAADDVFRRAGAFVDKIFHGANPADLPVGRRRSITINLKNAQVVKTGAGGQDCDIASLYVDRPALNPPNLATRAWTRCGTSGMRRPPITLSALASACRS